MTNETIKMFEAGLAEIKAMQASDKKQGDWGRRTTGAHVLNLLKKLEVRVQVTTDPECDCCGGNTYYFFPDALQPAAIAAGLQTSLFVKRDSKIVTDAAKKFHAYKTLDLSPEAEQDFYEAAEREISKILYA